MDHFSSEHWVQFVQESGPPELRAEIEAHLTQGCGDCDRTLRLWNVVLQAGRREMNNIPPNNEVERAKRLFSTPEKSGFFSLRQTVAKLIFNSTMQPLLAGVRSSAGPAQQFVYEAAPFTVAIQIRPLAGDGRSFLVGQILSNGESEIADSRIDVTLLSGEVQIGNTTVGPGGEFDFEVRQSSGLSLRIEAAGHGIILAELPDQLRK